MRYNGKDASPFQLSSWTEGTGSPPRKVHTDYAMHSQVKIYVANSDASSSYVNSTWPVDKTDAIINQPPSDKVNIYYVCVEGTGRYAGGKEVLITYVNKI